MDHLEPRPAFIVRLVSEPSDEQVDRLYGIADDVTVATCQGAATVAVHRETPSLDEAIRSALADLKAAGIAADEVVIPAASFSATD